MLYLKQNILVAKKESGEKERKWYSASVMDVYDNEVLISLPRAGGKAIRIKENSDLEVSFVSGGVRYLFESGLAQKFGQEALVIKQPRLVEKIELRQYPRAKVGIEIFYSEICSDGSPPNVKRGYLLDISGNGMRITSDQLYSPGISMSVSFNLPDEAKNTIIPVEMMCKVVRVIVDDRSDPVEYQLGLSFSRVSKSHRGSIVNYVNGRLGRDTNKQKG